MTRGSEAARNGEDSLKKRYLAKLFANLVGLAISLVTQAIIPRGLGPTAYGNFSFLSNFFTRIVGFLDMGTSIGFYTKLSQRQQDFGLVSFYLSFTGLASLLLIVFVGSIHVTGAYTTLLPDQTLFYLYLAAVWGILTWFVQVLNKIADAYGVTVSTEIARIIQKGFGLVLILALFLMNQLNLTHFFFYHYFILIFLVLAFNWVMERSGHSLRRGWRLTFDQIRAYAKEFYNYSHPLFVYALVGLIVGILDRWMLQRFAGSVEQGFYGLSYQIGAVCFLFTSAMTPLITREFAIAFGEKDLREMARLFRCYIPTLYAIAAYFACFIAVEASKVTFIMGGEKFQHAALAVMIMAFYPIHQTYGQLSGSVFYATGQTALYRNIGITFMLVGLPITYLLIAPGYMLGLNAGATGLAIKMVALQFIGVNVQLWFNARLLKLRFWRYMGHQIVSVGCLLGIAGIAMFLVDKGLGLQNRVVLSFFLSGILYTLMTGVLGYAQPVLFGLQRRDIHSLIQTCVRKFN
jgi:O-antigen/teichoic acid export membrane protein